MKKSANVCVVIPLYKTQPSELERKSVEQARKIFAGRDIFYVVPVGFDSSAYGFEAPVEFPTYYFQSLVNYSELCCLHEFYEAFKDYEYMLIYQPDCWVFEDKLDEFCAMGFDYIGAPWPKMPGIPEDGVLVQFFPIEGTTQSDLQTLLLVPFTSPNWGGHRGKCYTHYANNVESKPCMGFCEDSPCLFDLISPNPTLIGSVMYAINNGKAQIGTIQI